MISDSVKVQHQASLQTKNSQLRKIIYINLGNKSDHPKAQKINKHLKTSRLKATMISEDSKISLKTVNLRQIEKIQATVVSTEKMTAKKMRSKVLVI